MTSSLAQQLNAIQAQRAPAAAKKQRGKPSLLFDAQRASDLDADAIYDIGCQGLAELCRLNPAYGRLREALFSRAAASLVRDQQQPEAIAQLDSAIQEFCSLLSQHFLTPGAFKALEYLIRKFKANEHNISALLTAAMPYHATNEFVLLVKTLPLDASRGLWGWLAPIHKSGASLVRGSLVARCIADPKLLAWLGDTARRLGSQSEWPGSVFLTFYATVMSEIVTSTKVLDEQQTARLLPWVTYGLDSSASPDYRAATLMIAGTLVVKVTLSKETAKALVNSMLRSHPAGQAGLDGLMLQVLALVCATQPSLQHIPDKALKALLKLPSLSSSLEAVVKEGRQSTALLSVLTGSLVKRLASHPEDVTEPLRGLIKGKALAQVATKLATQLLLQACPDDPAHTLSAPALEATQQLLRALDTHYPTETDTAVNTLLTETTKTAAGAAQARKSRRSDQEGENNESEGEGGDESDDNAEGEGDGQRSERAGAVFAFVQSVFSHTLHAPCGDQAMTLAAAATAPAAGLRLMALQRMTEVLDTDTNLSQAVKQRMSDTILNGLTDEDMQVVTVVFSAPFLRTQPVAALLPRLTPALLRASAACCAAAPAGKAGKKGKGGKGEGKKENKESDVAAKHARAALLAGLGLLSDLLAASSGLSGPVKQELSDVALLVSLQCLLPEARAPELAGAALGCLERLPHPLLAHRDSMRVAIDALAGACADAAAARKGGGGDADGGAARKAARKQRDAAALRASAAVVSGLGQCIAEDSQCDTELPRVLALARQLSADAPAGALLRARHVLMLALHVGLLRAARVAARSCLAATACQLLSGRLMSEILDELAMTTPTSTTTNTHTNDNTEHATQEQLSEVYSQCFNAAGEPIDAFNTHLHTSTAQVHQALLYKALRDVCDVVPPAADGAEGAAAGDAVASQVRAFFARLAALSGPEGIYDAELLAFVSKQFGTGPAKQMAFFASFFCDPAGTAAPAAVVAALRLAARVAEPLRGADAAHALTPYVPHVFVAMAASAEATRRAAVAAARAVAVALQSATDDAAADGASQLLFAVVTDAEWVGSDAGAARAILRELAGSEPASAPSTIKAAKAFSRSTQAVQELICAPLPTLTDTPCNLHAAAFLLSCMPSPADLANASGAQKRSVPAPVAAACMECTRLIQAQAPQPLTELQARVAAGAIGLALVVQQPAAQRAAPRQLFLLALAATHAAAGAPAAASADWFVSMTPVRSVAVGMLATGQLPLAVAGAGDYTSSVVQSLALCAMGDPAPTCRAAARGALEAMPIDGADVLPFLTAAQKKLEQQAAAAAAAAAAAGAEAGVAATPTPQGKRQKRKGGANAGTAPNTASTGAGDKVATGLELTTLGILDQAVLVLELLQWKTLTAGEDDVIHASQQLLTTLQPALTPLTEHQPVTTTQPNYPLGAISVQDTDPDNTDSTDNTTDTTDNTHTSPATGYAAQLLLQWLAAAAGRQLAARRAGSDAATAVDTAGGKTPARRKGRVAEGGGEFDLGLVVRVAQSAPDAAARNAALSLLTVLAGLEPQQALEHVLQVLTLVRESAGAADDDHSQQVATTAMASVVPTWVDSGRDVTLLWKTVTDALPALPAHRRVPLLATLLRTAGGAPALPAGLLVLLQHVVAHATDKQLKKAGKATAAAAGKPAAAAADNLWMLDVAGQLAEQVPLAQRVDAFAKLLQLSVEASQGAAYAPLSRLAVRFIAAQLQSKGVKAQGAQDLSANEYPDLPPACETLMMAALDSVQRLVAPSADQGAGGAGKGEERAVRAAVKELYGLFEALQTLMQTHSYLKALLRLAEQPSDKIQRRALTLFAERTARLPADLLRIADHPAYTRKAKTAATEVLTKAAMQVVPLVQSLATQSQEGTSETEGPSALTHQAALRAFTHVVIACGATQAADVLAAVPAVLRELHHPNRAVQGSALAALAAAIRACKTQILPQLPALAQAVLTAAETTAVALPAAGTAASTAAAAPATPGRCEKRAGASADAEGDGDGAGEDGAAAAAQVVAVELSAALSCILAMVEDLGAFISPYLPAVWRVVLHPSVLSCQAAGVAAAAAGVRSALAASVAPRLLLAPTFAALPYALDAGVDATRALLAAVTACVQRMDAATAATHSDAIFTFILQALDVRGPTDITSHAAVRGHEHEVESAAVQTLVTLTLKLSEVQFRPLFLRLLEWATLAAAGASNTGRLIGLFTAAAGLAEKLRSVFVPYYRHLLDLAVKHLQPAAAAVAAGAVKASSKKRRKSGADAAAADAAGAPAGGAAEWVLRLKIVRALHRCFLYDSVGWLDGEKVGKVLPALVAQLCDAPAAGAAADAVAAQCADAELDSSVKFAERSPRGDVAGTAAVAALVQLAVAANSDVHWKPLNHQVLMTTRNGNVRTRCLALEVVAHMVDRLREEYLVLLPETLPFLSELLEDPEVSVESRAQQVLASLEEIGGEKLDQYLKT